MPSGYGAYANGGRASNYGILGTPSSRASGLFGNDDAVTISGSGAPPNTSYLTSRASLSAAAASGNTPQSRPVASVATPAQAAPTCQSAHNEAQVRKPPFLILLYRLVTTFCVYMGTYLQFSAYQINRVITKH